MQNLLILFPLAPRRVSLPRSDSLPSLQGYQPLSRSESIPAKSPRERAECRPPLSKVSRSFSEYVELSPIALESVPEAPSPTKSESSSSKFQTKTVVSTQPLELKLKCPI